MTPAPSGSFEGSLRLRAPVCRHVVEAVSGLLSIDGCSMCISEADASRPVQAMHACVCR
jgi:hypothetical protein